MKFRFTYSLASEYRVVQETLADLKAITEEGYDYWLPEGISPQSSPADIRKAISSEFDTSATRSIRVGLREFIKNSDLHLEQFWTKYSTAAPLIHVTLTRYGVGGYYETPNQIVINQHSTWDSLESVIVHELVHLCIEEPIVNPLKLDDSAKEGLVDYLILNDPILQSLIPRYRQQPGMTPPTSELLNQLPV